MDDAMWREFHFLRPWWLALLPVGVWLIWQLLRGRADSGGWRSVVDAALRAHVLAEPEVLRESRWPLIAALACLAARGRRARGARVGALAGARVSLRGGARRRARPVALDGRDRRRAVAARARAAQAARSARAARRGPDRARRVLDARVHGDAAHDRHAHDRRARGRGEHGHHADAGQLAVVRPREGRHAAAPDGPARTARSSRSPMPTSTREDLESRGRSARRRLPSERARGRHGAGRADRAARRRVPHRRQRPGRDPAARRRGPAAARGRGRRPVRAARARRPRSREPVSRGRGCRRAPRSKRPASSTRPTCGAIAGYCSRSRCCRSSR